MPDNKSMGMLKSLFNRKVHRVIAKNAKLKPKESKASRLFILKMRVDRPEDKKLLRFNRVKN
jgi:hypothetical protein